MVDILIDSRQHIHHMIHNVHHLDMHKNVSEESQKTSCVKELPVVEQKLNQQPVLRQHKRYLSAPVMSRIHRSNSSQRSRKKSSFPGLDLSNPKLLFSSCSTQYNRTKEDQKRSLALLKLVLEYNKKKRRVSYIDSCEVPLIPSSRRKGNICMYCIAQNNLPALEVLLNYSLTVDVFNFSMVQFVVNSIYAKTSHYSANTNQQQQLLKRVNDEDQTVKTNAIDMLLFLEKEFGANIIFEHINRQQTTSLETPLHVACAIGDIMLIRLLLMRGAAKSVNVKDFLGQTPIHVALTHCNQPQNALHIVRLLVEHGASIDQPKVLIDTQITNSLMKQELYNIFNLTAKTSAEAAKKNSHHHHYHLNLFKHIIMKGKQKAS